MDEINQEAGGSGKRSDVGYGRPPRNIGSRRAKNHRRAKRRTSPLRSSCVKYCARCSRSVTEWF